MSSLQKPLSLRERADARSAPGEGRRPKLPLPPELLAFARTLRQQQPDAESRMWLLLRSRRFLNWKFRRQHSFPPYVLDFYCDELKLAVELDGGQHVEEVGAAKDELRTSYLRKKGIQVIRYWNHDVLKNPEGVLQDLMQQMQLRARPSPDTACRPLPEGEAKRIPSPSGRGVRGEGPHSNRTRRASQ